MARVFISYAHADADAADEIRVWLCADGHEVFLDRSADDGLRVGEEWKSRLYAVLRGANALVCVVSTASKSSAWCGAEIGIADALGCLVLPLQVEGDGPHPVIASLQHADYGADPDGVRERVLARLREIHGAGWDGGNPFPGLQPFDVEMHRVFFGREAETEDVLRRLRSAANQPEILVIVGPSGCGKSSLVRAGVTHRLSREPGWMTLPPVFPGRGPLTELARAFGEARAGEAAWAPSAVRRRIADDGLLDVVNDFLTARHPPAARLLLVLDQFEEILTPADATGRRDLATMLAPAVMHGSLRVVVTMRSEFLDPLLASAEFTGLPVGHVGLRPLDPQMLPTVVEEPMKLAGLQIAPELVSRIVADTGSGEALPLLAYTLSQLTEGMQQGSTLTLQAYKESEGVRGTLIQQANTALEEAIAAGGRTEPDALKTLLRLVRIDSHGHVSRDEADYQLLTVEGRAEIDAFVRQRLLVTRTDPTPAADDRSDDSKVWVGVAHEAFLREWPPLAAMIDAHAAALGISVAIEDAAAAWEDADQPRSHLWDRPRLAGSLTAIGARLQRPPRPLLDHARHPIRLSRRPVVVDSPIVDLTTRAQDFLTESSQRNRRRRRRLVTATITSLVVAFTLTSVAFLQRQDAINQKELATARELVARAEQLRASDVSEALKFNLAAEQIASNTATRSSLAATLAGTPLIATVPVPGYQEVTAVAFSPDGHTLAAANTTTTRLGGFDGAVQLWDMADRHAPTSLATIPDGKEITAVAFSPDGRTLAVASAEGYAGGGAVQLWDVTDKHNPTRTAAIPADQNITAVAFSPDGHMLVAAASTQLALQSQAVQLWDVTDKGKPRSTATIPDKGHITAVAFSPDGHTLATTGVDNSGSEVRLWDMADRHNPTQTAAIPDKQHITGVAFSPDGHTLTTLGDGIAQLWDVVDRHSPTRTTTLPADRDITAVAFSPDGHTLATATTTPVGGGRTVQLWDVTDRNTPTRAAVTIRVPDDQSVTAVAFSPDGHTLTTTATNLTFNQWGGYQGVLQLWDVTERHIPTRTTSIPDGQEATAVAFSPDGHTLTTTTRSDNDGGMVQLWDVTDRDNPTRTTTILDGQEATAVAFSPDGRTLATSSGYFRGGAVQLWDVTDRHNPRRIAIVTVSDDLGVTAVAFSPDGRTLAVAAFRGLTPQPWAVQLWDVTERDNPIRTATVPDAQHVTAVAFSPDGHTLATATAREMGDGGTMQLWDVTDRHAPIRTATVPDDQDVTAVVFSPDGHTLATTTAFEDGGGTVQTWDVTDRHAPARTATVPDGQNVTAVAFSPDGHTLATTTRSSNGGGTLQLWDTAWTITLSGQLRAWSCSAAGGGLTADEWSRVAPDIPYHRTCKIS